MKRLDDLLASIDEGDATMADVDAYLTETQRASEKVFADLSADIERAMKLREEAIRKQAMENRLRGRSRIAYALASRK